MGMPSKLKNMNTYLDGVGHLGIIASFTVPKLALKMEEWRGGGMLGPIMVDQGLDKIEAEFTMGGLVVLALRQFGATQHDAALLRFAGAYQDDGTGAVKAAEFTMRGRYSELDWGDAKPGDDTEHKSKMACSYLRIDIDGRNELEVDLLAGVFIVNGIDRYAEIRAAIGG
jgi:P2 family phage contractile tail tube protein